jgi:molybdate transport system substrate-binding protein
MTIACRAFAAHPLSRRTKLQIIREMEFGIMKARKWLTATVVSAALVSAQAGAASAAEIKVLATHAVQEIMETLGPQFEKASGHKLVFSYDPSAAVRRQIEEGAAFDVAIITRAALEDLAKKGKLQAATIADIGKSGLGVAVKKGAPKPDIGTVEAFKRTLLAAKSVVRSTEGASGAYFEKLLGRLGIADAMKDKVRLGPSGRISEMAARGEVELAVQQISEILPVKGADFVGPFPAEIQLYTLFSIGLGTGVKEAQAAKELVAFVTAPAAAPVIKSKGLEPAM